MRKIRNPWLGKEGYDCFGCSPDNPIGLKMEFYEDGEDIVCYWKPSEHYQGWVESLHGGIQATLMDECAAWVVSRKLQTTGVTSKLDISYRKPIYTTETHVTVKARLKEMKRNLAFIHISLYNSQDQLCSEADTIYFTFPQEKARQMGFTECETENEELLF